MSRPVNINETVTFNPTGNTGATNMSENASYPWTRGYNSISNTSSYARLQLSASSTSTDCYVYYTFSVSDIPSNATITNVSCVARIYRNSRVTASTAAIQLYNGTTAKGEETNSFGTSASNVTISNTGSWTVSELNDIRLRIKGRRTNTNNSSYIYFYGANLSITYSIQGTEYEVVSTLATDAVDSIDPAGQAWVFGGDSYVLSIFADSSNGIEVTDNGVEVTDQLVLVHAQGNSSTYTCIPSSYDSANSDYASTYTGSYTDGLAAYNDSDRFCVYVDQTAYAEAKLTYNFDCAAIPQNATITSVTCKAGAACYSNGQYFDTRTVQLYSGSTAKGTATTITGTGNTNTEHNINGGSWTRAELDNAKIVIRVVRGNNTDQASFSFWGATLSVTYSLPEGDYYTYTLSNVSADHTIIISDSIIEIPDEDPEYNYYPITVSSINATTEPGRGTVRLVEGSNQTITIYPDDPSVTLILDNGQDVSNRLVTLPGPQPSYTVDTAPGASYGFAYSSSTEYYTSQNNGVASSAAVARVSFDLPVRCLVTFQYINYAEATYDFGVFGKIDTTLSTTGWTSTSNAGDSTTDAGLEQIRLNTSSSNSANPQTLTYEIPAGTHYIDVKFGKDQASDDYNDTLQFKITDIQELEPNNSYTYTLSNIQEPHSLIFIFGDVIYYFVNSGGTNARLFPSGQMVQLPGDTYRLTVIPDDYSYDITVTDNNVDVTNSVQKKEEEITKEGVTTTVVNYIYTLNNIAATHNIVATCFGSGGVYVKVSDSWVTVSKIYKKQNNAWVEQSDISNIFETGKIYINNSY